MKVLTICPFCGCGCGLYLETENGFVTGSYPSLSHPVSRGGLCVKGWNSFEFINNPDRLKKPLMKEKSGSFREVEWDEALQVAAGKLLEVRDRYGPDSIGFLSSAKCSNEENYLMMKLARAVFKTNNVDHCARLCHSSSVTGLGSSFGSGAMTNSIDEIEDAEVFLVTGSDTTSQHPLIGSRIINAVCDRGAKLILVDPRKIRLAKFAEFHLQQRCGTDIAWINGMMRVIIKEKLHKMDYINERTENFSALSEKVSEYPPERVEKITGIKKELLIKAARAYATAKKAMIIYSMGITQHTTGTDNVKSLANLSMLTAHVGYPSTGVNPLRGQNNVQGACDAGALPDVFSGYQKVVDLSVREKFQEAWGVEKLPDKPGLTVTEMFDRVLSGEMKAMYQMGENPPVTDPDSNKVREAFEKLGFLVTQDIFMSDACEYADVVFPASSFAEKDGTYTNTDRRVQFARKVIEPVGESKPDWQILCEVAQECGYSGMRYGNPSEVMDEIARLTPIYGGIVWDRLQGFGLQWPCPDRNHPGTVYLHKDGFTRGKGRFFPCDYSAPDEEPDEEYNFILTTGRTYWQWHSGTMTRRTSTLDRENHVAYVEVNPGDAERIGIRDGEFVKVSSKRGEIKISVRVTDMIDSGCCFIPFHFREAAANVLTNPAVDPVAKIPEYKVCACKIEKL